MPNQIDVKQLRQAIRYYSELAPKTDAAGQLQISVEGDDLIDLFCREVAQTRLGRQLFFSTNSGAQFKAIVKNGRLFEFKHDRQDSPQIDCSHGTVEDAKKLLAALEAVLFNGTALTVRYERLPKDFDHSAIGLSPASILKQRTESSQASRSAICHTTDRPVAPPDSKTANRDVQYTAEATTDPQLVDAIGPDLIAWIETLNEGVFDEIELTSSNGYNLQFDYSDGPVQIRRR